MICRKRGGERKRCITVFGMCMRRCTGGKVGKIYVTYIYQVFNVRERETTIKAVALKMYLFNIYGCQTIHSS